MDIKYNNYNLKSHLEWMFCCYLDELKEAGFIKEWNYETVKFELTERIYLPYLVQLKTKIVSQQECLLRENTYQPDFPVVWDLSAKNIFYLDRDTPITTKISNIPFRLHTSNSTMVSLIEAKPDFEKLNSSIEFNLIQKQLYKEQQIYVQKVKIPTIFKDTFIPKKALDTYIYLRDTEKNKKGDSKFKFKTKTLDEYLKHRNYNY